MMKRIVLLLVVSAVLLFTASSINRDINQTKDHSTNTNDTTDIGNLSEVPSENDTSAKQENIDSEQLSGPDVAELVNLRGDEVTVYKLADGTYMDRAEKHFTYNGTDTWIDKDGVEWNEKVQ